jgi:hypothetical protein
VKTIKIQGGIGNQLFGLALAHSAALVSREPVAIDLAAYRSDRYGHTFILDDLALELGDFRRVHRPLMGARLTTALTRAVRLPGYVREGAPPADRAALAALIAKGGYFNGYWQDEAYIAAPEVFAARTRGVVFRRAKPTPNRDVLIHYRTYKDEIRARARRTPGADYIRAALAHIEATLGQPAEVALVSDDPALALRTLGDLGRTITVAASANPWDDLAHLMSAQALVLTNSSFSWWGGFCGPAKVVVYPRREGFFHYPMPAARFDCL